LSSLIVRLCLQSLAVSYVCDHQFRTVFRFFHGETNVVQDLVLGSSP